MEPIVNKVAESGIITLNLEQFLPNNMMMFDMKSFLFMELILKEKDFRAALLTHDWTKYEHKNVYITCTADAIIPVWAYMLVVSYLQPFAQKVLLANEADAQKIWILEHIQNTETDMYIDQRIVIKGCGEIEIPNEAYVAITQKLRPIAKSIMYGEPCSTVPIFKKKKVV